MTPSEFIAARGGKEIALLEAPAVVDAEIVNDANTVRAPWEGRIQRVSGDWFASVPPRREWLLCDRRRGGEGVLPMGKVGQLIGEGGVSKTSALIQLALAVATGAPWFGTFDVPKPGRVLACFGEEDAEELHRRFFNAAKAMSVAPPKEGAIIALPLVGMPVPMIEAGYGGDFEDAPFLTWLRDFVSLEGPFALVLLDPLSRFAGSDAEKDNAVGTRFIQGLESLVEPSQGATILACHHTNKVSRGAGARVDTASGRGSSSLTDGVRWVAALSSEPVRVESPEERERLGEVVTLAFTKSNYSRKADPLLLRRDPSRMGTLVPLDAIDVSTVSAALRGPDRREARSAELAARREERERAKAEEHARKEAAAVAKRAARFREEELAALAVIGERPGITLAELRSEIAAKLGGCGHDAAKDAITRLGPSVRTETGKSNSKLHYLAHTSVCRLAGAGLPLAETPSSLPPPKAASIQRGTGGFDSTGHTHAEWAP